MGVYSSRSGRWEAPDPGPRGGVLGGGAPAGLRTAALGPPVSGRGRAFWAFSHLGTNPTGSGAPPQDCTLRTAPAPTPTCRGLVSEGASRGVGASAGTCSHPQQVPCRRRLLLATRVSRTSPVGGPLVVVGGTSGCLLECLSMGTGAVLFSGVDGGPGFRGEGPRRRRCHFHPALSGVCTISAADADLDQGRGQVRPVPVLSGPSPVELQAAHAGGAEVRSASPNSKGPRE